jgi:hypothetical protein
MTSMHPYAAMLLVLGATAARTQAQGTLALAKP